MSTRPEDRVIWYDATGARFCIRCACYMEVALFPRGGSCSGTPDGLSRYCRLCWRAIRHATYERHRDREIAYTRAYQAAHPTETRAAHRLARRVYHVGKQLERAAQREDREEQAG